MECSHDACILYPAPLYHPCSPLHWSTLEPLPLPQLRPDWANFQLPDDNHSSIPCHSSPIWRMLHPHPTCCPKRTLRPGTFQDIKTENQFKWLFWSGVAQSLEPRQKLLHRQPQDQIRTRCWSIKHLLLIKTKAGQKVLQRSQCGNRMKTIKIS